MKINQLDVELTSRCNLKCYVCHNAKIPNKDVDLSIFSKINTYNLDYIDICGNVGEPICHPNLLEFIDIVNNGVKIKISTNGTLHDGSWWRKLAKKLSRHRLSNVIFALDGLEDSHCRYRVGTNYKKLLKNIESFTSAGGNAYAQFIIFKHNQNELESTKKLAEELGCKKFIVRTSCFYNDIFERPDSNIQTRHEICTDDELDVLCSHLNQGKIFVDFEGEVFPCCLSANCKHSPDRDKKYYEVYQKYKKDINLKTRSLEDILNGPFYKFLYSNYKNLDVCQSFCRAPSDDFNKLVIK